MKVLLVNKFFYPKGGAEKSYFETGKLLENKNHKVIYFSMCNPRNVSSYYNKFFLSNINYDKENIRNIIKASLRLLYSFEAREKIENLIKKERPDVAHLNNVYHQMSPSILHSLKKFKIPIVMSLRDYKMVCASYSMINNGNLCEACKGGNYYQCFLKGCVKNSRLKSLLNTIEMYFHHKLLKIYDLVDLLISPSKFLKMKMLEMGLKKKIVHLPNFVRLKNYKPSFYWKEESIVYFGRLEKIKGLFTLIEAVKDLNINLKIIGEGTLEDSLKRRIIESKIKNVNLMGYMSDLNLHKEIKNSMFIVLPSEWYENNPRAIIEGFALGKPAIGSRIGGIPELIKDSLTGFTFETGNVADLRLKIEYLLNNQHEISKLGINARKFVEEKLNEDIHYEKLMEIYSTAMNES